MSQSLQPYEYEPLDSNGEIRLLNLLPGTGPTIDMKIQRVKKKETPKYEALSYVWGSPELTHEVLVRASDLESTKVLRISQNLFIALCHLRYQDQERTFWIDAICIDQGDLAERSREIGGMGLIFKNASLVVVWLGEERADSALAIETFDAIARDLNFSDQSSTRSNFGSKLGTQTRIMEADPTAISSKEANWVAIKALLERPWFTRLWIIQEIFLASEAIMVVGEIQVAWDGFRHAMHWVRHHSRISTTLANNIPQVLLRNVELLIFHNKLREQNYALLDILYLTRNTRCLDARDRIYAILDLLRPDYREGIIPDYKKSIEAIYTAVVLQNVKSIGRLELFGLINFRDGDTRNDNQMPQLKLPSWIPDFSRPAQYTPFPMVHSMDRIKNQSKFYEVGDKMETPMIVVDIIKDVSPHIAATAGIPEIIATCRVWEPENASTTAYVGGGTVLDAFVTILGFGVRVNASQLFYRNERDIIIEVSDVKDTYEAAVQHGLDDRTTRIYNTRLEGKLPGQAMLSTDKGYIGLTQVVARANDLVSIILGCGCPMILRPIPNQQDHYHIIGPCSIEGLMMGEGLLGPTPPGWTARTEDALYSPMHTKIVTVLTDPEGRSTQLDPRAGPLPSGWALVYGENDRKDEFNEEGGRLYMRFKNSKTGEVDRFDPRFTSQSLRERGVNVQDVFLV